MELEKLRSEKKLILSFDNLKSHSGTIIIYQNLCSIVKKLKYILKDEWHQRGHILIFSETLTKPDDEILIENYTQIFRSDATKYSRGIIAFARDHICINNVKHLLDTCKNNTTTGHVELFSFEVQNFYIISGYKSPGCSDALLAKKY